MRVPTAIPALGVLVALVFSNLTENLTKPLSCLVNIRLS
jgi:hypothetical protein